jgi:hypothetical protein
VTKQAAIALCLVLVSGAAACGSSSTGSQGQSEKSTQASASTTSSESFDRSNWDLLVSDPDAHKGARVDFVGRVLTTPERDKDGVYLQVYEDPQNAENNTIVGYPDPSFRVAEDDYVHVTGTVKGTFSQLSRLSAEQPRHKPVSA